MSQPSAISQSELNRPYRMSTSPTAFLPALLSLTSLSGPYASAQEHNALDAAEVDQRIKELQGRFPEEDDGLDMEAEECYLTDDSDDSAMQNREF